MDNYRKIVNSSISTDIIVDFPTETEAYSKKTLDLVKTVKFDSAYIFKYSPHTHTNACRLADDVPLEIKKSRHHRLLELQKQISKS